MLRIDSQQHVFFRIAGDPRGELADALAAHLTTPVLQRQLHIKGMPLVIMPMQVDTR